MYFRNLKIITNYKDVYRGTRRILHLTITFVRFVQIVFRIIYYYCSYYDSCLKIAEYIYFKNTFYHFNHNNNNPIIKKTTTKKTLFVERA